MRKFKLSNYYFAIALVIIIALNVFVVSRLFILQGVIETMSQSIAKIPELSKPLVLPESGR